MVEAGPVVSVPLLPSLLPSTSSRTTASSNATQKGTKPAPVAAAKVSAADASGADACVAAVAARFLLLGRDPTGRPHAARRGWPAGQPVKGVAATAALPPEHGSAVAALVTLFDAAVTAESSTATSGRADGAATGLLFALLSWAAAAMAPVAQPVADAASLTPAQRGGDVKPGAPKAGGNNKAAAKPGAAVPQAGSSGSPVAESQATVAVCAAVSLATPALLHGCVDGDSEKKVSAGIRTLGHAVWHATAVLSPAPVDAAAALAACFRGGAIDAAFTAATHLPLPSSSAAAAQRTATHQQPAPAAVAFAAACHATFGARAWYLVGTAPLPPPLSLVPPPRTDATVETALRILQTCAAPLPHHECSQEPQTVRLLLPLVLAALRSLAAGHAAANDAASAVNDATTITLEWLRRGLRDADADAFLTLLTATNAAGRGNSRSPVSPHPRPCASGYLRGAVTMPAIATGVVVVCAAAVRGAAAAAAADVGTLALSTALLEELMTVLGRDAGGVSAACHALLASIVSTLSSASASSTATPVLHFVAEACTRVCVGATAAGDTAKAVTWASLVADALLAITPARSASSSSALNGPSLFPSALRLVATLARSTAQGGAGLADAKAFRPVADSLLQAAGRLARVPKGAASSPALSATVGGASAAGAASKADNSATPRSALLDSAASTGAPSSDLAADAVVLEVVPLIVSAAKRGGSGFTAAASVACGLWNDVGDAARAAQRPAHGDDAADSGDGDTPPYRGLVPDWAAVVQALLAAVADAAAPASPALATLLGDILDAEPGAGGVRAVPAQEAVCRWAESATGARVFLARWAPSPSQGDEENPHTAGVSAAARDALSATFDTADDAEAAAVEEAAAIAAAEAAAKEARERAGRVAAELAADEKRRQQERQEKQAADAAAAAKGAEARKREDAAKLRLQEQRATADAERVAKDAAAAAAAERQAKEDAVRLRKKEQEVEAAAAAARRSAMEKRIGALSRELHALGLPNSKGVAAVNKVRAHEQQQPQQQPPPAPQKGTHRKVNEPSFSPSHGNELSLEHVLEVAVAGAAPADPLPWCVGHCLFPSDFLARGPDDADDDDGVDGTDGNAAATGGGKRSKRGGKTAQLTAKNNGSAGSTVDDDGGGVWDEAMAVEAHSQADHAAAAAEAASSVAARDGGNATTSTALEGAVEPVVVAPRARTFHDAAAFLLDAFESGAPSPLSDEDDDEAVDSAPSQPHEPSPVPLGFLKQLCTPQRLANLGVHVGGAQWHLAVTDFAARGLLTVDRVAQTATLTALGRRYHGPGVAANTDNTYHALVRAARRRVRQEIAEAAARQKEKQEVRRRLREIAASKRTAAAEAAAALRATAEAKAARKAARQRDRDLMKRKGFTVQGQGDDSPIETSSDDDTAPPATDLATEAAAAQLYGLPTAAADGDRSSDTDSTQSSSSEDEYGKGRPASSDAAKGEDDLWDTMGLQAVLEKVARDRETARRRAARTARGDAGKAKPKKRRPPPAQTSAAPTVAGGVDSDDDDAESKLRRRAAKKAASFNTAPVALGDGSQQAAAALRRKQQQKKDAGGGAVALARRYAPYVVFGGLLVALFWLVVSSGASRGPAGR